MSAPDNAEPTESRSSFESQSRLQPAVRDHPHPSIFPLPTEAIFRQPQQSHIENSSRSSSSRTKRKRGAAIDDGSDTSHHASLTRASSTSDFSNTMKAQLRAEYRNKCWHCGASPADVCHIIGNRDNTFKAALEDGLIDFDNKRHPHNAIALCGTCHRNFDDTYNPSFFFLPTDMNYFITFEKEDRKRRRTLGRREGTVPARICPTAQTYREHQLHEGVSDAVSGGLYTRIVLHDFLPEYPGRAPFVPGLSEYGATKPWSGSPMAALQRAVIMLRRLNLRGIPREIRHALRELQDVYSEPINLANDSEGGEINTDLEDEGEREGSHRTERGHAPGVGGHAADAKTSPQTRRTDALGDGDGDGDWYGEGHEEGYTETTSIKSPTSTSQNDCLLSKDRTYERSRFWRWGPSATSDDAVKFFRRVL